MRPDLVTLDRDHPGFRDPAYRARRNAIAQAALDHRAGDPAPVIPYTDEENGVWHTALAHLVPVHARVAASIYRRGFPALNFSPDGVSQLRDGARTSIRAPRSLRTTSCPRS